MPGVLQLEAIAQTAGILTLKQAENLGKLAYFMSAESVTVAETGATRGHNGLCEIEMTKSRGKIGKRWAWCMLAGGRRGGKRS